ncbi:MAG: hypothetical protein K2Z81_02100 [Cyanobacteria bacterium]|nr:hypothetical protein [Cyanobacteriota bacterium]
MRSSRKSQRATRARVSASSVSLFAGKICRMTFARLRSVALFKTRTLPKRIELARSDQVSPRDLLELVQDPNPLVRMEVAWNRSATYSILLRLRHDKDATVANVARRRLMSITGFDQ